MSLIFDALQRSEAERSGIDVSALSAATEVLERAEGHAAASRNAATAIEQTIVPQSAERDTSLATRAMPTAATSAAPGPGEVAQIVPPSDVFGQFQSLQVEIPPQSRLVCLTDSESLA